MRFPLQGVALTETSHISLGDRFAAQIVYRAVARQGVGGFIRKAVALRYPVTELSGFLSFQFTGRD